MNKTIFTDKDHAQFQESGMDVAVIEQQIEMFRRGVPFLKLDRACTIGDGILRIAEADKAGYIQAFEKEQRLGRVEKFVPASGAASRMFKALHGALNNLEAGIEVNDKVVDTFAASLERFAFYGELKERLNSGGHDIEALRREGDLKPILHVLLGEDGMNYGNKPKGLLLFHRHNGQVLTPIQEHFAEALAYARADNGTTRLHFTVSPEHQSGFESFIEAARGPYEEGGSKLELSFSVQKAATDTVAVDMDNQPFRNGDGSILFRPGGHGALIENVNDRRGDIIFIKNIDNVVPDRLKAPTIEYKKILGGYLVTVQAAIFGFLKELEQKPLTDSKRDEILTWMGDHIGVQVDERVKAMPLADAHDALVKMLNRPIRVCGMVKNEGEPGGGPFWVKSGDGPASVQIVESSQIDSADPDQKQILETATHFNPVDLVCAVRDYRGEAFDLRPFVDPEACFISEKSKDGKQLKALELPGLWNGAMAGWNTVFVEVPLITFNPVKIVNDLLRDEHQA